jgi:RHS repeat-associated protein
MQASTESARYLYSGDKVILETDPAGNETAVNIYGMNLISRTADGTKLYYLYNAHADVTGLADSGGNITDTYRYDAFGNITEKTGEATNPYTYAGYRYDKESDLYYLNARYYDAKIARFLTVDTYRGQVNDPLSLNLYTYCVNNPIQYYDPTGHIVTKWDKKNLSKENQKKIDKYTKKWNKYDKILKHINKNNIEYRVVKYLRDKQHREAERIRDKKRDRRREKGRDDGYTVDARPNEVIRTRKDTNSVESKLLIPIPTVALYAAYGLVHSRENYSDKYDYRDIIKGEETLLAYNDEGGNFGQYLSHDDPRENKTKFDELGNKIKFKLINAVISYANYYTESEIEKIAGMGDAIGLNAHYEDYKLKYNNYYITGYLSGLATKYVLGSEIGGQIGGTSANASMVGGEVAAVSINSAGNVVAGAATVAFIKPSKPSGNKGRSNHVYGQNGTQVSSKTVWQNGKTERIDVENPAPGQRPGQIHYHDAKNNKWYYDSVEKTFYNQKTGELAPKKIQKLLNNSDFQKAIKKGLDILGEN